MLMQREPDIYIRAKDEDRPDHVGNIHNIGAERHDYDATMMMVQRLLQEAKQSRV